MRTFPGNTTKFINSSNLINVCTCTANGLTDFDFCPRGRVVSWGPPRVKVRGGKGSWTERQIGMLLSYFVQSTSINKVKCHKMLI